VTIKADQKFGLALQKAAPEYRVKIGSTPTARSKARPLNPAHASSHLAQWRSPDISLGNGSLRESADPPTHPALQWITISGQVRDGKVGIFYQSLNVTQLTRR